MKTGIIILLACLLGLPSFAQKERPAIRKGNDFYENGKYTEAEIAYRKSLEIKGDTYEGNFNLGNALLKQKKYDESLQQLEVLASTETDKDRLADVFHNLGNAYLESKKLKESIAAYKNALRNKPGADETRYNLAYAQTLLKEQQEQEKENKDQDKDQEDQEKEDQEKKEQEQKDKEQQEKEQKDKEEQDKQQQNQQDEKDKKEQEQKQQQQQQEKEVSKQMAEQLLKALEQDEKDIQEKVKMQKVQQAKSRRVEKDW